MLCYPHKHPYFHDDHPVSLNEHFYKETFDTHLLNEFTYKDMLRIIDPRDLPHRDYAPLIPYVRYVGTEKNIMKFFVPSPTKINMWNTYIEFVEWDSQVVDTKITPTEAARLLLWSSDIRVHCGCPSFIFWGYQYILTQLDASIYSEERYPHIRNPNLKGIVCKHLRRTLKVLPFHLGDMATAIKQQRQHFG